MLMKQLLGEEGEMNINEEQLLQISARHRIAPQLYTSVASCRDYSDSFKEKLQMQYLENTKQVIIAENFLDELNQFFKKDKIQGIILKGIPLSENYYNNKFIRHSRDLDLLIDRKYLSAICNWLHSKGYRLQENIFEYPEQFQRNYFQTNHHLAFYGILDDCPKILEIHWKLRSFNDAFPVDPFIDTSPLLSTQWENLRVLNHLDQFIYLCIHGAEHGWYRLKWLVDLPMLMKTVFIPWDELMKRSSELHAQQHVLSSLHLLNRLAPLHCFQTLLSGHVSNDIRKKSEYAISKLCSDEIIESGFTKAVYNIFYLSSFNGRWKRSSFWKRWFISTSDWKRFPLPPSLFFLYYPLRPIFWGIRKISS